MENQQAKDTYKKEMERRLKSIDIEMNSMIWRTVN